jgi:hypothetical protein
VFVASVFAILSAVYLQLAIQQSYPVPYWDESGFIPYVTGDKAIDFAWLWTGANEHRMPLVRLLYVFLARIGHYDMRVINAGNVSILASAAAMVLFQLREINRKTQFTDAVIPFALLTFGLDTNLQVTLPTCLICVSAGLFALSEEADKWRGRVLGPAILGITVSGVNGLIVGLAMSPILLWVAYRQRRRGLLLSALVTSLYFAAAAIYAAFYNSGLDRVPNARPFVLLEGLTEGLKAGAMCFGPAAAYLWPYSGAAAVFLFVACGWLLYRQLARALPISFSAAGLTLTVAGLGLLAVTIGLGRTTLGANAGFAPRYALMMTPIPIIAVFAFDRFGSVQIQNFARIVLFTVSCVLYWPDGGVASAEIGKRIADGHLLKRQIESGIPIPVLANEFGPRWMFTPPIFSERMQMLAKARMGVYRDMLPSKEDAKWLYELSANTELKGPSTAGNIFEFRDFSLPGSIGMIAHPVHRGSVAIPQGVRRVQFGFGLLFSNQSDGVEFRVHVRKRSGGSQVEFWSRRLDPIHVKADVGLQIADVELPIATEPGDRLVFETLPIKDPYGCWAYWSNLSLR